MPVVGTGTSLCRFLCLGQEKKRGDGVWGDRLHWRVQGSTSSLTRIGSMQRVNLKENNLILSCNITSNNPILLLSYFSFQPVLHDWCNKGRAMCYPVCGMVHIKEPLLLIGKSSPCGCSGFSLSISEWSSTICPTPYNHK